MSQPLDARFASGLTAYRAGEHFEAHEHWEGSWRDEPVGDRRAFLQALIQIAAAMHKLVDKRQPDSA